jgi:rRNA-processing protein FCF1
MDDVSTIQVQTALVIDTNFVISHLNILKDLHQLSPKYGHIVIIPWVVIQELDKLKTSDSIEYPTLTNTGRLDVKARAGINWIFERLAQSDPNVIGQKMTDTLMKTKNNDDAILDCCLYFHQMYEAFTVVLSNDKNLCTKALIHNIKTVTFVQSMTAETIAETVFKAAVDRAGENNSSETWNDSMELDEDFSGDTSKGSLNGSVSQSISDKMDKDYSSRHSASNINQTPDIFHSSIDNLEVPIVFDALRKSVEDEFLLNIKNAVDYQMRVAYNNEIQELEYFGYSKDNLDDFASIRDTLKRYSISVFSPLLPRGLAQMVQTAELLPVTKKELFNFIDIWGSVWINLERSSREKFTRGRVEKYKTLLAQLTDDE